MGCFKRFGNDFRIDKDKKMSSFFEHLKHTELICNYVFTLKTENLIEFNQLDHTKQV